MYERIRLDNNNICLDYSLKEKLSNLKYILNRRNIEDRKIIDEISSGRDMFYLFSMFQEIINRIQEKIETLLLKSKKEYLINQVLLEYIKKLNDDFNSINLKNYLYVDYDYIPNEKDLLDIEKIIDLATKVDQIYGYVIRRENEFKTDKNFKNSVLKRILHTGELYAEDMKYYFSETEIEKFKKEFKNAFDKTDINEMIKLTEPIRERNLKEIKKIGTDIETMTDENICFLGTATNPTYLPYDFKNDYKSNIFPALLYNQDVNDTFYGLLGLGVGFILSPKKVIAADNYAASYWVDYPEPSELPLNSTLDIIPMIRHPKSIQEALDYCQEQNPQLGYNAYFEVALSSFEPIGIFCIDTIFFDYYNEALKLQKSFPNLKIKRFNALKIKKGKSLVDLKIGIIGYILTYYYKNLFNIVGLDKNLYLYDSEYLLTDHYEAAKKHISKFDYFFQELEKKPNASYEEIFEIFAQNIQLIFDKYVIKDKRYLYSKIWRNLPDYEDLVFKSSTQYNKTVLLNYKLLNNYRDVLDDEENRGLFAGEESLFAFTDFIAKNFDNITQEMMDELKKEKPRNYEEMTNILSRLLGINEEKNISQATKH